MMRMNKLLRALLAPFFLFIDEEDAGGGPASGESDVDWGALTGDVEPGSDDSESDEAPASAPAPAPSPAPAAAKPTTPAVTPQAKTTSPEDPAEQAPELDAEGNPVVKAPPEEPAETQLTPEQIAARDAKLAKDFEAWEEAQLTSLTEQYKIGEEDATRLQTEPELVLPQLAAKMHMEVMKQVVTAVQRLIPQMVTPALQQKDAEKGAKELFYGKNPDLVKYETQVLQAGAMFRKMNPKASPEEAAEKIGNIVRATLGLAPVSTTPGKAAATTTPKKTTPHKPAGAGGGSGTKPTPAPAAGDVWSDLMNEDD